MRAILLLGIFFMLAGCAPSPEAGTAPSSGETTTVAAGGSTGDSEKACRAKGGTFRPVCMMGKMTCVLPYADAGKPCTGKAQCQGQCRYEGKKTPAPDADVIGACQRTTDPCGCFGTVEGGKLDAMMCVD